MAKLLTAEEEIELARRIHEHGDEDAFETLVKSNLALVVFVVQKMPVWSLESSLEREDLIQEGNVALMLAARSWRPQKRFASYARKVIYGHVMRAVENMAQMIRVPVPIQEKIRKVKKTEYDLLQSLGREPTAKEIAKAAGMAEAMVKDCITISQRQPVSLDVYHDLPEEDEHYESE
jgi:RNA polymerase sigma factor (sigma-70 family)